MKKRNQQESTTRYQGGFTLLELLVIISILAAIAFITTGTFKGVQEGANDQLVRSEMQQIAKAIRQFKQDTGYYPKTGPFNLANYGGEVTYASLPSWAGSNNAARDLWFYSPANFHQLLISTSPLDLSNDGSTTIDHQLELWNPETGRGWRGPYVNGFAEGYLDVHDTINDGTADGEQSGHFREESPAPAPLPNPIPDVPGIADPFEHRGRNVYGNTLLDWSACPNDPTDDCDNEEEREFWGRPYLFFDLQNSSSPLLISMGGDGVYRDDPDTAKNEAEDNIKLYIE